MIWENYGAQRSNFDCFSCFFVLQIIVLKLKKMSWGVCFCVCSEMYGNKYLNISTDFYKRSGRFLFMVCNVKLLVFWHNVMRNLGNLTADMTAKQMNRE
jgi:hypothetical protein